MDLDLALQPHCYCCCAQCYSRERYLGRYSKFDEVQLADQKGGQCSGWRFWAFDRNNLTWAIQSQRIVEVDACIEHVNSNCNVREVPEQLILSILKRELLVETSTAQNGMKCGCKQPIRLESALRNQAWKSEAMDSSTVTIQFVTKLCFTLFCLLEVSIKIFKTTYWKLESSIQFEPSNPRILTKFNN